MEEHQDVTLSHLDELTQVRGGQWLWFNDVAEKRVTKDSRVCSYGASADISGFSPSVVSCGLV